MKGLYHVFSTWARSKLDTFCDTMRVKAYSKGHVIMEENGKVDDIIWVRSGSLRVDK